MGISEETRNTLLTGSFTQEDIDYDSKRPYYFSAGGKGLELLLMEIYGQLFGFHPSVKNRRCIHLPMNKELCPGRISLGRHCREPEMCPA
jgi:hypothetical protein